MDFDFHYTKEQEDFRKEVRAFIEANALKEPIVPEDNTKMTEELGLKGFELERKLGERGWFAPGYPKEYGGGGLDTVRCAILAQELARISEERRWPGSAEVSAIQTGGIMNFGTEEQKRKWLPKLLGGQIRGFQCFTEPDAGTDEASMKSTAARDGDAFIINGDKVFVGNFAYPLKPDYLYWPAVTDPKAPRHQNISAFFIPADLPGITYTPLDLVVCQPPKKWEVICEDVRCPADCLIGELNKGWLVTQATLAAEHGGGGALIPRERRIMQIIDYCKKTLRNGRPISNDPLIQDILVQLYIEYHVGRLWGLRNYAMSQRQIPRAFYTGTQTALHGKRLAPLMAKLLVDIFGPQALLDDEEVQILGGATQYAIRLGDVTHEAGTPEAQQIMMARALGLGRGVRTGPR